MNYGEIAAVSGKSTLFKVISPTKSGVILESMDEQKKKMVATMRQKISVLSEISIYTTDAEGVKPLDEVMFKIHEEFEGDTGLSSSSDADELKSFMRHVLPEYDEDRVYVSDIKKLVNWYAQLVKVVPELLVRKEENTSEEEE